MNQEDIKSRKLSTKYRKHNIELNRLYNREVSSDNNLNYDYLSNVYKYIIGIAPYYYVDGSIATSYEKGILYKMMGIESKYSQIYIIDSAPFIKKRDALSKNYTSDELLNYIVYKTREFLSFEIPGDIKSANLTGLCYKASVRVKKVCEELGLACDVIRINAGFSKEKDLFKGSSYHYFNIVTIKGEKYLIDCTYRQFFTLSRNNLNRIGVMGEKGCRPGAFIKYDEYRLLLAKKLLKKGWIKISEKVLKAYFDGFALSFRNGLYYEETGDYSFKVPYTVDDYCEFINGTSSQIKKEGEEVIGLQLRPLKKPLNFDKK